MIKVEQIINNLEARLNELEEQGWELILSTGINVFIFRKIEKNKKK